LFVADGLWDVLIDSILQSQSSLTHVQTVTTTHIQYLYTTIILLNGGQVVFVD